MASKRTTAKKATRKRATRSSVLGVITTESVFVRFPRPQSNNGKGNEEGPIVGIEVMLAKGTVVGSGRSRRSPVGKEVKAGTGHWLVYWTTDGKEGMTSYSSLPQLIRERQLAVNPLTMHRIHEAELKLRREAMGAKR